MCTVTHLFTCLEYPPNSQVKAALPHFIAYALHRTKLHSIFIALVLVQGLKWRSV